MLLWLNGMTATRQKTKLEQLMEDYEASPDTSILDLLIEDEFYIQAKNLDPRTMAFISKHAISISIKLMDIIIQPIIEEVTDQNYDKYAVYPLLSVEFFELDLPVITQQLLTEPLLIRIFRFLETHDPIPEAIWNNINRLIIIILPKDGLKLCQFVYEQKLGKFAYLDLFLNHLSSTIANSILIQLFSSEHHVGKEYSEQKFQFVSNGLKGIQIMEEISVLNFTFLIHEIMTKYFAQDQIQKIITHLTSYDIIKQLFGNLKSESLYLSKSAGHILSLVSNYYSYQMQNIIIDDFDDSGDLNYHKEITKQFEESDFMRGFNEYIGSLIQVLDGSYKTLKLKIVEIIDNLVRVSNLKIWSKMVEFGLLRKVIQLYFSNLQNNIFQALTIKLINYIFDRTISDFHPFWSTHLLNSINIYDLVGKNILDIRQQVFRGPLFGLANLLNKFQRDLGEKLLIDGSSAKFFRTLQELKQTIDTSQEWTKAFDLLCDYNDENRQTLGEMNYGADIVVQTKEETEGLQNNIFSKVKSNIQPHVVIEGDHPNVEESDPNIPNPMTENVVQTEEEEYQYNKSPNQSPNKVKQQLTIDTSKENKEKDKYQFADQVFIQSPEKVQQQQKDLERGKYNPIMSQSLQDFVVPVNKDKVQQYYQNSPQKQQSNSNQNSPQVDKSPSRVQDIIKKYSQLSKSQKLGQAEEVDIEKLKSFSMKRRQSMESSTKLKFLDVDTNEEFKISKQLEQKVIIQPFDQRVLMVDEIDQEKCKSMNSSLNMSNISFESSKSQSKRLKITYKKGTQSKRASQSLVPMNEIKNVQTEGNLLSSLNDSFISVKSSASNLEEKKFRKATKKDEVFLSFIKNK